MEAYELPELVPDDDPLDVVRAQGRFLRDRIKSPVWQNPYDEAFASDLEDRLRFQLQLLKRRRKICGDVADEYPARWIPENVKQERRDYIATTFAKYLVPKVPKVPSDDQDTQESLQRTGSPNATPSALILAKDTTTSIKTKRSRRRETGSPDLPERRVRALKAGESISVIDDGWSKRAKRNTDSDHQMATRTISAARPHRPITRSLSRRTLRSRPLLAD